MDSIIFFSPIDLHEFTFQDKNIHAGTQSTLTGRCSHEGLGQQDSKLPFQENNCEPVVG